MTTRYRCAKDAAVLEFERYRSGTDDEPEQVPMFKCPACGAELDGWLDQ